MAVSKLQVNPQDVDILAYLANYSAMIEDRKAALGYLAKAQQLAPSKGEVLFRAAIVHNHFNQVEQAIAELKKAIDAGYSRPIVRDTPDFQVLLHNPAFAALVANNP